LVILVVGESVIDLVESPDGSSTPHPGGSPANVAVGLGRLGLDVTLATQLGDDRYGRIFLDHFEDSNVQLAGDPVRHGRTSAANVQLTKGGEASYTFDVSWNPRKFEIPDNVRLVHTGSIASQVGPGDELVDEVVTALAPTALVSYDPNIRPSLLRSRSSAVHQVEHFVGLSDLVKVSEGDLHWLYPDRRPESIAYGWLKAGASIVVVTSRDQGWRAYCRTGTIGEAHGARKVVDTIGAGDAFTAAIIAGLERHDLLDADKRVKLRDIDLVELEDIVALGARAAVLTVGKSGAEPPRRSDLWPVRGQAV
jgi:fructokinase